MRRFGLAWVAVAVAALGAAQTSPKEQFGKDLGADYFLANYAQLTEYWKKLDKESDRFTLTTIGKTAEGREQYMAIVTDPANHRNLARYKDIAKRLAKAEALSEQQARELAKSGKSVVWIDGGLHATEVLCAQVLMETGWQLVSRTCCSRCRVPLPVRKPDCHSRAGSTVDQGQCDAKRRVGLFPWRL